MKKNKNSKGVLYIIYFVVILFLILFLLFNENGLLKYFSLKQKVNEIENEIKSTQSQIENHNKEIDSLKNSELKIEQVAREKYNMHKTDEKAFKLENSN